MKPIQAAPLALLLAMSARPASARGGDLQGRPAATALPLAGTRNPDPARIHPCGDEGSALEVLATGSDDVVGAHPLAATSPYQEDIADLASGGELVTADVRNVQWAVQNVPAGGTVRLRNGPAGETFHFGRSGIYLPGIRLVGAGHDAAGSPLTIIDGGLLAVRIDFLSPGARAAVDGLWFRATIEGAIYSGMADYDRLEVTRNKSTATVAEVFLLHPPNGQFYAGKLHFFFTAIGAAAVAPFTGAHAPRCNIEEVVIRGNVSDQLDAVPGGSEVELAFCSYRQLRVSDNALSSTGLSVELNGNSGAGSETFIEGNTFAAPGTTAVWVVGNEGKSVVVANNQIRTGGRNGVGMILSHVTPAAEFTVADNNVDLSNGLSAILVGFGGGSLNGATFTSNVFSGAAAFGVLAYDPPGGSNTSSNNSFVENDFTRLTTFVLDVFLGASTAGNTFAANPGLNTFYSPNPTNVLR